MSRLDSSCDNYDCVGTETRGALKVDMYCKYALCAVVPDEELGKLQKEFRHPE